MKQLTSDERWSAVLSRDESQDGRFVYAVTSTGIFCRPTCASRRPRPDRVRFFDAPELARASGFRPCRRCQPELPNGRSRAREGVARAVARLRAADGERVPLERLAREAGLSLWHFQRTFKALVGVSPREFQSGLRSGRFREALQEGVKVTDAIYEAGYGSSSRLYAEAGSRLGMNPRAFARGGSGQQVQFSTAATPFGRLLVASTARGLCAVMLGDCEEQLVERLSAELPQARLSRDRSSLGADLLSVLALLEGRVPRVDLPTDVKATAFQFSVWKELARIPRGETRSYAQIARSIGAPAAARAVARACASNRLALVVPCHRAVRSDGQPSGYRWGAERKARLLEAERSQLS